MLPSGSIKWKDSELKEPRTLRNLALRYMSSSSLLSSLSFTMPAPSTTGRITLRASKSLLDGVRFTAYPIFLPLQCILQSGVDRRLEDAEVELLALSKAILRVPPRISLAKIVVGTGNSRRRIGFGDLGFGWMQNLTFPLRYPKMVPVIVEVVMWHCGDLKVELQVGIRRWMRERRSRHDRTCLWQSTVVMVAAAPMLVLNAILHSMMILWGGFQVDLLYTG